MNHHTLPGGRFGTERLRDLPSLAVAVTRLMTNEARPVRARAHRPEDFTRAAREWSRSLLEWLEPDLELRGLDRVDWSLPHVIVPLHEGIIDPIVLLAHLPTRLRFVARTEIADWPVVGPTLGPSGQILLEPESPAAAARTLLREGRAAIAAGFSPVVFAQGTLVGIEAGFEEGAFALARMAGVDVVPIVLTGTHRVYEWPFGPVVRRRQPIFAAVLEPMTDPDPAALERRMRALALANRHAPVRRFEPDRDGWWDGYRFTIADDYPELAARVAERRQASSRRAIT